MIRLQRPPQPLALQRGHARAANKLEAIWAGGADPVVKGGIYNHQEVKTALRRAQHNKCAYCETRDARSPGAIEHFRPKSAWQQVRGPSFNRPGYFWLAYEWTNLLFSCSICNDAAHKGNFFPLENPAERATATARDTALERPLLLNPYGETNPEDHIDWDAYIPRARAGSVLGQATIEALGLARDRLLIDERRSLRQNILGILDRAESEDPGSVSREAIKQVLLRWLDGTQEYTAMIRQTMGDRIRAL